MKLVPLAEENGTIIELGWFAIEEVLKVLSGPLAESGLFVTAIGSFWQIINELIKRGYPLAIDDFGTGESSFHRLYSMAFDTLKIDRSFVTGLNLDERNQEICRSLMNIGATMGSQIVAEGVETEEEHQSLKEIGIKYTQGYLYGRPEELEELGYKA